MEPTPLVLTRLALHALAEHLLAADLWRHTERIGLRRTPGGFGQPEFFVDGVRRRLRIDGTSLVVLEGDTERWTKLSTPAAAAEFAGASLGAPTEVFTPTTELHPDEILLVDAGAAAQIATWFELVEEALEELRRRYTDRAPAIVQLWPEHFDLACSMSEVNFGGSPGDDAHAEPYLYVGPWGPVEGPEWNEPWGMSQPSSSLRTSSDAVDTFERGLRAAQTNSESAEM